MKQFIIIILAYLLTAPVAHGQGGIIDNSFGNGGKIVHNIGGMDIVYDIEVLSDDKFLATGIADNRIVVAKFLKDGMLDKNFAGIGYRYIDFLAPNGYPTGKGYAVTTQKDGKILVVGKATTHLNQWGSSDDDFVVARLNADGSYDLSFNGTGMLSIDLYLADECIAVTEQPDGKILLGGNANKDYYGLVRLNADGSPDNTFNGNGKVLTEAEGYGGYVSSMLLQPNGKIVLVGRIDPGTSTGDDIRLIRYNTDGSLDNNFGTNGIVTTDISNRELANAACLLADGSIMVTGLIGEPTSNKHLLLKYKPDGILDATFGNNGYATLGMMAGGDDMAIDLVVQPDAKIIIAGRTRFNDGSGTEVFSLARFTAKGQLDVTFGNKGKIIQPSVTSPYNDEWCNAVALQNDGRILAAGYTTTDQHNTKAFLFTRYHSDVTASVTDHASAMFNIYPNPASTVLVVEPRVRSFKVNYTICNMFGRVLLQGHLSKPAESIDVTSLSSGNYCISVLANNGISISTVFSKQ